MSLSLKSVCDGAVQIAAFIQPQPWMMHFFGILCDERGSMQTARLLPTEGQWPSEEKHVRAV